MIGITFNFTQLHQHGSAFFDFLNLRKKFFVDELGWEIPHDNKFEMDQYDNPTAWYSLVLREGQIVGGARTMSTTAKWGNHSYMLRDAIKGKLIDIPDTIMDADVASARIWECTRLVISNDVDTQVERSECLRLIVSGLVEMAAEQGAVELMSLSPLALTRALRQLGFGAKRVGTPYKNEGDGRRYAVLSMPTLNPVEQEHCTKPVSSIENEAQSALVLN